MSAVLQIKQPIADFVPGEVGRGLEKIHDAQQAIGVIADEQGAAIGFQKTARLKLMPEAGF